ncbi:hypothetical protein TWF694_008799 [Orbilia ellipsospora]|uniref:Peptidase S8/S53 domain-containing protein n=1 Tax=Orbilia ellipsospora TaxID=2528407 RepID=A0AAV9XCZ9_9PEZI
MYQTLNFASLTLAFLQLTSLYTRNSNAAPDSHPSFSPPRIGTSEKASATLWFAIVPDKLDWEDTPWKTETNFFEAFRKTFYHILLPPKKFAIHEMRSENPDIGLLAFLMDVIPGNTQEILNFANGRNLSPFLQVVSSPHVYLNSPFTQEFKDQDIFQNVDYYDPNEQASSDNAAVGDESPIEEALNFEDISAGQDPRVVSIRYPSPGLLLLSTPPGVSEKQMWDLKWRWKAAGQGTVLFVVDTGCDTRHPDLRKTKFKDWIYGGPMALEEPGDFPTARDATGYPITHGTSMVATAVGQADGVAVNPEVVVVKVKANNGRPIAHEFLFADALMNLYDYIWRKKLGNRCVINMSFGAAEDATLVGIYPIGVFYRKITSALLRLGCYVAAAARNVKYRDNVKTGRLEKVNIYPALLGRLNNPEYKRFVAVGGHDLDLNIITQTDAFVKIFALATNLYSAKGFDPSRDYKFDTPEKRWLWFKYGDSSASAATAQVSGLLATFMSLGIEDPVAHLYAISKKGKRGIVRQIAFNGIYADQWPTYLRPPGYRRIV